MQTTQSTCQSFSDGLAPALNLIADVHENTPAQALVLLYRPERFHQNMPSRLASQLGAVRCPYVSRLDQTNARNDDLTPATSGLADQYSPARHDIVLEVQTA